METSKEICDLLDDIRVAENYGIRCNEVAVENEVIRHHALFSGLWIKFLSVILGFVAGGTLLGFLFLAGLFKSEGSMLVTGIILIAISLTISIRVKNVMLDAMTLSLYVIGCALFGIGTDSAELACWSLFIIAFVTAAVTSNYILVFIATLLFCGSFVGAFFAYKIEQFLLLPYIGLWSFALTAICCAEARLVSLSSKINRRYKPVVAGMFVSLIACFVTLLFSPPYDWTYVGILSLCLWVNILFLVWKIVQTLCPTSLKAKYSFLSISVFVLLPAFFAPVISGAVFLMLLAFRFNYKSMVVASLMLLILALIQYYYDLNITLLVKSGILFFSGLLFLAFWFLFQKTIKNDTI